MNRSTPSAEIVRTYLTRRNLVGGRMRTAGESVAAMRGGDRVAGGKARTGRIAAFVAVGIIGLGVVGDLAGVISFSTGKDLPELVDGIRDEPTAREGPSVRHPVAPTATVTVSATPSPSTETSSPEDEDGAQDDEPQDGPVVAHDAPSPSDAAGPDSSVPDDDAPARSYRGPGLQARDGFTWADGSESVSLRVSQPWVTKNDPNSISWLTLDGFANDERVQVSTQFPDHFAKFTGCSQKWGRCHLASSSNTAEGYFSGEGFLASASDWPRGTYRIYVDLMESKVSYLAEIEVR